MVGILRVFSFAGLRWSFFVFDYRGLCPKQGTLDGASKKETQDKCAQKNHQTVKCGHHGRDSRKASHLRISNTFSFTELSGPLIRIQFEPEAQNLTDTSNETSQARSRSLSVVPRPPITRVGIAQPAAQLAILQPALLCSTVAGRHSVECLRDWIGSVRVGRFSRGFAV
jgi:hypothetical protein